MLNHPMPVCAAARHLLVLHYRLHGAIVQNNTALHHASEIRMGWHNVTPYNVVEIIEINIVRWLVYNMGNMKCYGMVDTIELIMCLCRKDGTIRHRTLRYHTAPCV